MQEVRLDCLTKRSEVILAVLMRPLFGLSLWSWRSPGSHRPFSTMHLCASVARRAICRNSINIFIFVPAALRRDGGDTASYAGVARDI